MCHQKPAAKNQKEKKETKQELFCSSWHQSSITVTADERSYVMGCISISALPLLV
jgi:hypothetical protein